VNFIKQNIEKMEDFSQSSTASTIPPEIISYDDDDFLEEIDRVNDLQDNNIILMVSKFVGKPLLLRMQLAGKQSTLFHNH
jgi:hypothetical protein